MKIFCSKRRRNYYQIRSLINILSYDFFKTEFDDQVTKIMP